MWRYYCITSFFLFLFAHAVAQKPVVQRTQAMFLSGQPATYDLFTPAREAKGDVLQHIERGHHFSIRNEVFDQLRQALPGLVKLKLPDPFDITLDLYRANVFSEGAKISTSDGRSFSPNASHAYYRGMISGNPNSLAVVSVFEGRVQIMYSDDFGNYRIQQMQDGTYLALEDRSLKAEKNVGCFVDDSNIPQGSAPADIDRNRILTGNCVEVYVECDFKSYQDNGSSVANTEEWVGELWNEVITLYENEDIPVSVSDILVYTSSDPFASATTTSAMLNLFTAHIDAITYDGRLAHLLSTRSLGGGIAYVDVLCSTSVPTAVSTSLSTNIIPVPTFSWSVECVTHEMGHNMGSQHTHACAWNGNNTAIDGCGPAAGYNEGCNAAVPAQGTIMSYCHLVSGVGINFNLGFGPQPGDRIRSEYNSASCNTGTCTPPSCTSITTPAPNATNVDINIDLLWASSPGATGYKLTVGTTPTNGNIANNLDVGNITFYNLPTLLFNTAYYVKIVPYNELGDAADCTNQSFTTESNVAPACTQMSSPANGASGVNVNAIIAWPHSVGNQTGYKISIGTTLNGIDIANQINVGNVNQYDHPLPFPYATTLYVKITPYWAGGDISGCASQSFTTWVPIPGDFCTTAIDIACGQSIAGTTLQALPETGLPFCGAAIEAPGVWYKFTGDGQNAVLYTCSNYNYDTQLNAYSGSCGSPVCVTGLDDFCSTGTQISFPTTAGTNYFILVQGWGGQQGNFTLTRTCYSGPFYCQASGRLANAEWIKKVVLGAFIKNSVSSSYSDFTSDIITVSRGGSYAIELTPMFAQGSFQEYYKVYGDFNKDGDFADAGENVFSAGPTNALVSGTVNIPIDAQAGNTRFRVVMSRNQITSPCGVNERGEVEDYTLNVRCNMVTSTSETGNGSLRNVSMCADDGENILFAPSLNNQTINVTNGPIAVDGVWKWMATAGTNIQIKAAANVSRVLSIGPGKSIEIQNLKIVGGNTGPYNAIENLGTLILRDCDVHTATGSVNPALRNAGTLTIFGTTDIGF
jgi:hypothetical protein